MLRWRARLGFAFAAAIVVVVFGAAASAGAGTVPGGAANESAQAWFVELASPPAVKGTNNAKLKAERNAFFANAALQGLSVHERYAFDTLWNGLSIDLPQAQAGALATVPGVKAVYPVVPMTLADDESAADGEVATPGGVADPDLAFSTGMIGAPDANAAGWTGKGVKIGIIDSGVDYTNPDLSDGFGAGHRVAGGWDFVGDDYDAASTASTFQPVPHPDPDPAPCDPVKADAIAAQPGASTASAGHGTHVASIGNSGANGLYSAGAPGVGKNVIGVASVNNLALPALTFTVDNGTPTPLRVPYLQLQSTKEAPTSGVAGDIVYVGRGCLNEVASPPPGNDPVPAGGEPYLADPKGKVALIRRGVCTFNEKYDRAVKAGAIGVIVMNQGNAGRTGLFAGGSVVDLGVPGVTI